MGTDIGDRITALRKQAKMTQKELANILEVSPSTVGMYEQGRRIPKNCHLVKLSRMFGVSIDYILTGSDGPNAENKTKKYGQIVEMVEQRLNVAEPKMTTAGGVLRDLTRNDLEYLCDAILSAQAELDENEENADNEP